jgi:hypothetical protein
MKLYAIPSISAGNTLPPVHGKAYFPRNLVKLLFDLLSRRCLAFRFNLQFGALQSYLALCVYI